MNEDFFQNISSTGNPIEYADTVQRYQTQLPLGISWPTVTGSLNPSDLYTDDTSLYMYYPSGVNKTAIAIQQRDRYGGITFTLVSGSTNLYIQASEYFADPNPAFISSPYTVSGEGGTNLISASYLSDTPENPQNYWINLPNPGTYKVVFPNPVISTAISVTHSGSSPYVFSQMLPRKSVGSYDIDVNSIRAYHVTASFIDAVAIQVSDSIVVGPDLIGAKSIDGSKIIDGTISGVLIRDGTVTGNKVLAGTISGVLITAGSITSNQIAVSGITAINLAANSITADNINVRTITADKIVLNGITSSEMAAAAVTSTVLANNAVVSGKVAASAIYGENIVGGTITGYHVAANTITAGNITAGTITFNEIASNTLTADQIANGTLTGQKILEGTISGVLIREGTITGSKILANTISGALITAGTITANEISAGTITATQIAVSGITANRLNVTQLDAVAANMGTLVVNSGISVGTNGYISVPSGYISAGNAKLDSTGLQIGNVASSNLPSITDTLRVAGSGSAGNIVGMALYNGAFSATNPQAVLQLDSTNALEIEMRTISGEINMNFPEEATTGQFLNIYNADLYLKRSPNPPTNIPGGSIYGADSDDTVRYYIGADQLLLNNNTSNTFTVDASTGDIVTAGVVNLSNGSVTNPSLTFTSDPDTGIYRAASNTLGFATGGAQRLSLSSTGASITGKVTSSEMGYLTVTRTATLAITTAGTTIVWQSVIRQANITVSTDTITIQNAGYYMFSATFGTVANLTSLRMTLQRGVNYVSTVESDGLSTGGGYIFNFSTGFYASAGSTYKIVLTPSANTTLNFNGEGFAGPTPILNIFQSIGV